MKTTTLRLFSRLAMCAFVGSALSMSVTSCSDDDDDDITPGKGFIEALEAIYPNASGVKWEQKKQYTVAEFRNTDRYETEVWFNSEKKWVMTAIDYGRDEAKLPTAALEAIAASDFSTWIIDDIDYYQRDAGDMYVVEMEQQGSPDTDLAFSVEGKLLGTFPDGIGEVTPLSPVFLPE